MPVKANNLNLYSKRFDFGVPLEDVFPPNDIHPRLKYLFEEAYRTFLESGLHIGQILRQFQGSLETRLKLKEKIIHDVHYQLKRGEVDDSPGAYFWVIRHFLGLLPVPLLPTYANEVKFDWSYLSEKCRRFLHHYEVEGKKKYKLDYAIAENLNLLPFEHFLLLNVLVIFMRKLSQKFIHRRQINRRTLLCLAQYYCPAIGVRPYIPGHNTKDDKIFPLFFYMLLRWRYIEKKCKKIGHPSYFLETDYLKFHRYGSVSIRDSWAQTANFNTEIITIYKNVPYFCNNNNYLKDTGCQTASKSLLSKSTQHSGVCSTEMGKSRSGSDCDKVVERKVDNCPVNTTWPVMNEDNIEQDEKLHDKSAEFSFLNKIDTYCQEEWSDVVKETFKTIKKVEEYIYDDYETFSKEAYNQITDHRNESSIFDRICKLGWTYTPPHNRSREESTSKVDGTQKYYQQSYFKFEDDLDSDSRSREESDSKVDDIQNCSRQSYFRFEDVFDRAGNYKTNDDERVTENHEIKDNSLNITFKKSDDSKITLCDDSVNSGRGKKTENDEGRSKKTFNLKRFKVKLDFLRVLAPKKTACHPLSYDSIESKVKYKKMKNVKSNTF